MSVVHNDVLRVVQFMTLPNGNCLSNKFYLRADLTEPVSASAALDAIETWVAFVYNAVRTVVTRDADLIDGQVDIIKWDFGAWRTVTNLGVISPDPDWVNITDMSPDPVAGLVTFTTSVPRVRRPFYVAALTEDRVDGSRAGGFVVVVMVRLGERALLPVDLMPSGLLYPVVAHALVGGTQILTGFTVTNLLRALHRRRPTS